MLYQRVLTAIVLLAAFVPALLSDSPWPLIGLALVFIVAAAWEWGRMCRWSAQASVGMAAVCLALCALYWQLGWMEKRTPLLWLVAGLAWVGLSIVLLRRGVAGWDTVAVPLRTWPGVLLISLAWLALAQARHLGIEFVLSALCLVWMADISAYFSGRAWGRSKLAPGISPGKSWAGVYGAAVCVCAMALVWVWLRPQGGSLYARLFAASPWLLPVGTLLLTAMSVVGDLVESLVKRSAGIKDSSALLPGHGGVLDRIDALLPVLPLVMMLASWSAS